MAIYSQPFNISNLIFCHSAVHCELFYKIIHHEPFETIWNNCLAVHRKLFEIFLVLDKFLSLDNVNHFKQLGSPFFHPSIAVHFAIQNGYPLYNQHLTLK